MVGAEVIANSPSIWEKVITINRGSKDGLEKRMPVILKAKNQGRWLRGSAIEEFAFPYEVELLLKEI